MNNKPVMKFSKNGANFVGLIVLGAVLALAGACTTTTTQRAPDTARGGGLANLTGINTLAEAEALQPGDSMAMVCAKCKSVVMHNVTTQKGHIKTMTVGEKHLCPGCNSTIEVVGHGKAKTDVVRHVCKACGEDSAFCCATRHGQGPTPGMQR